MPLSQGEKEAPRPVKKENLFGGPHFTSFIGEFFSQNFKNVSIFTSKRDYISVRK